MTVEEYATTKGISEKTAKKILEKAVKDGVMFKQVYDVMKYRRIHGYSGRYMPTKITEYFHK